MAKTAGKPTRNTPRVRKKLSFALRQGATYELAAQYAGVHRSTLFNWIKYAKAGDPKYLNVLDAIKAAEAFCAIDCLEVITQSAASGSWQSAAWLLERRYGYRKESTVTLSAESESSDEMTIVDPNAPDGRALIVEHVSKLPEDLILAALNLKNAAAAK
tara:strand:- start:775 stop:1251 length:477 start_codon:yes stop_codon:yes gene_type:complete